jgi:hypothetical protein
LTATWIIDPPLSKDPSAASQQNFTGNPRLDKFTDEWTPAGAKKTNKLSTADQEPATVLPDYGPSRKQFKTA